MSKNSSASASPTPSRAGTPEAEPYNPARRDGYRIGNIILRGDSPLELGPTSGPSHSTTDRSRLRTPTTPKAIGNGALPVLGGKRSPKKVSFGNTPLPPQKDTRQRVSSIFQSTPLWGRRKRRARSSSLEQETPSRSVRSDSRSRAASEALRNLQSPPASALKIREWTLDDQEAVEENINVLLDSTQQEPDSNQNFPSSRKESRKRSHSYLHDPYESTTEEEEEEHRSQDGQRKRIRSHRIRVKPVVDLAALAPEPLRIDYRAHPLTDRSDDWFIRQFQRLFHMCEGFSHDFFGVHDLESGINYFDPWSVRMTPEFIDWVELVAEEDNGVGGWEKVLKNTEERKWVVMAVLVRVLRAKVFDVPLWGADKYEEEMYTGIERAFIGREGFQRTLLRSQTTRQILSHSPVTRNFYPDIAELTAQVTLLLKPLSDYLYSIPPAENVALPIIQDQYQALHNIISHAAYLSLSIRLSPSIFFFHDISLGEAYDPSDQWNLEMDSYRKSKEAATETYNEKWKVWEDTYTAARRTVQNLRDEDKESTKEFARASKRLEELKAAQPYQLAQLYGPMCKTSVWPVITRYKPGGKDDDIAEKQGEKRALKDKDGFRIYQISKGAVVSYFGEKNRKGRVRLQQFWKEKIAVRARERGNWSLGGVATVAGAVIGVGWIWREMLGERLGVGLA